MLVVDDPEELVSLKEEFEKVLSGSVEDRDTGQLDLFHGSLLATAVIAASASANRDGGRAVEVVLSLGHSQSEISNVDNFFKGINKSYLIGKMIILSSAKRSDSKRALKRLNRNI